MAGEFTVFSYKGCLSYSPNPVDCSLAVLSTINEFQPVRFLEGPS